MSEKVKPKWCGTCKAGTTKEIGDGCFMFGVLRETGWSNDARVEKFRLCCDKYEEASE